MTTTNEEIEHDCYHSYPTDGTPYRLQLSSIGCEWCGNKIQKGRLTISRKYVLNGKEHIGFQHLTCYDLTYEHCKKHGHTFEQYKMQPAIKSLKAIGELCSS